MSLITAVVFLISVCGHPMLGQLPGPATLAMSATDDR